MSISEEIQTLFNKRSELRAQKKYQEADAVRDQLNALGFIIEDTQNGSTLVSVEALRAMSLQKKESGKQGKLALFGSGETSPTGRKVHEILVKDKTAPIYISLLETPAGFEVNPHNWYKKLATMLETGLQNYKPQITVIDALSKDGPHSTNTPESLQPMLKSDYIHTGAGSPTYAAKHLAGTLAMAYMADLIEKNTSLSFASAAAIAIGKHVLPVYEIYKAGDELHWHTGANFFAKWGMQISIIPHFNNEEGGVDIDTAFCYMGKVRFEKLIALLPTHIVILGIDEQTACIFTFEKSEITVSGIGSATVIKEGKQQVYRSGDTFGFEMLK
jgi:hypothetical protein